MKNPIVFYHADCLDGFSGAWAAWKKFGSRAEYRALSHEVMRTPRGVGGRDVYFIDYCLPAPLHARVRARAQTVTVIDHHITHRRIAQSSDRCVFDLAKSGCVLSWEFFHTGKKVPLLLFTVQDYDLFTLKIPHTRAVVTALALAEREFPAWSRLVHQFEDSEQHSALVALGDFLLRYKEVVVERLVDTAEPIVLQGHRAYAVNTHAFYSEVGTRIYATKGVHLGVTWYYKSGRIKVSLRSDGRVDAGMIAARYGGGGHAGAAGFWMDFYGSFPWKNRI